VRQAGQDCEPVLGHVLAIPASVAQPTAQQLVELDDVLGAVRVAVAVDEHDWHAQALDVF